MARGTIFSLGDNYDGVLSNPVKTAVSHKNRGRAGWYPDAGRYEIRVQALRHDIMAADAEIEAGLGWDYVSGADLLKDVMNGTLSRLTTPDNRPLAVQDLRGIHRRARAFP